MLVWLSECKLSRYADIDSQPATFTMVHNATVVVLNLQVHRATATVAISAYAY